METTRQLLRAVKARHKLTSDGQLARLLGLERASISQFMRGKNFLGHDTALTVSELLKLPPDYVIACAESERAKSDRTKAYWRDAAQRAGALAACFLAVVAGAYLAPEFSIENGIQISMLGAAPFGNSVYYVKFIIIITAAATLIHSQAQKNN